jgi:hypothetical protein
MTYAEQMKTRLLAASISAALAMLTLVAATDSAHARPQHHPVKIEHAKVQHHDKAARIAVCTTGSDQRGPVHHSAPKGPLCAEGRANAAPLLARAADPRG